MYPVQASMQASLDLLALALLHAHLFPLARPGEMNDRNDEEAGGQTVSKVFQHKHTRTHAYGKSKQWCIPVRIIRNARQRVVPSRKGCQQSEKAPSLDHRGIRVVGGVALQVANAEEEEGQIEGEEQKEERDG